jgi:hypothetical protein
MTRQYFSHCPGCEGDSSDPCGVLDADKAMEAAQATAANTAAFLEEIADKMERIWISKYEAARAREHAAKLRAIGEEK